MTFYDLNNLKTQWTVTNPNSGSYINLFVAETNNILIVGDYSSQTFDFYDISNLNCQPPQVIGQFFDSNTGQILYDYPYLYGVYEPWQYYNKWMYGENEDGSCYVSVIYLPDTSDPDNNFWVKEYTASYDIVSLKKSPNGILAGYLQNVVIEWAPQFSSMIGGFFIDNKINTHTLDCTFNGTVGIAGCSAGGARFFNSSFTEPNHFITGDYAYDVVPWGDYLFVPSGRAGVAIIDNSDPSLPRRLSFLEVDTNVIPEVKYISVTDNGERLYLSDGSDKVWIANVSDKSNPYILSYSYYFSVLSRVVNKLLVFQNFLLVATNTGEVYLIDISNQNIFNPLDSILLPEGVFVDLEKFTLSSYPGMLFIATTTNNYLTLFEISEGYSNEVANTNGLTGFIAVVSNVVYLRTESYIQPVVIGGSYPFFTLSTTGTNPLYLDYGWGNPVLIRKYDNTKLVTYGDDINYGYPSIYLIDIYTDPLSPDLLPEEQPGVLPFNMLTGLAVKDSLVYYATDNFGTGALTVELDYDMPYIVSLLSVTPVISDIPSHTPNPDYWLTGTVLLSVTVKDDTSAIKKVRFKYNNRTIATLTQSTPAGQNGVYTYNFDTTKWQGSVSPGRIVIEITDSGCNTTVYQSSYTYAINVPPSFNISWDEGCNFPPYNNMCPEETEWLVCGDLNFTVNASAYYNNEVPNPSAPIDDITQIAYKIYDGSWVTYSIFPAYDGAAVNYSQPIFIDTTTLQDGLHTMQIRVTDDVGLQKFSDSNGISTWVFNLINNGPSPQIVSPTSGYVLRTSSVVVTAHMNNELNQYPTQIVGFYLDSDPYNPAPNGTLIGSTTFNSGNNDFTISWDATTTPLGEHTIKCWAYYYGCCSTYSSSPSIDINLVDSIPEPPLEISPGTYDNALIFNEEKSTIMWQGEASATGYRLYRGMLSDLAKLLTNEIDSCLRYDGNQTSVDITSDDPSSTSRNLYWYLVTGYNEAGEGSAGYSTTSERIVNSSGECF